MPSSSICALFNFFSPKNNLCMMRRSSSQASLPPRGCGFSGVPKDCGGLYNLCEWPNRCKKKRKTANFAHVLFSHFCTVFRTTVSNLENPFVWESPPPESAVQISWEQLKVLMELSDRNLHLLLELVLVPVSGGYKLLFRHSRSGFSLVWILACHHDQIIPEENKQNHPNRLIPNWHCRDLYGIWTHSPQEKKTRMLGSIVSRLASPTAH